MRFLRLCRLYLQGKELLQRAVDAQQHEVVRVLAKHMRKLVKLIAQELGLS